VALPRWFIRAYTDPDDRVYDPFSGSGSTLLAAEAEQRIGYGMEISPDYCDRTLRRWQRRTGVVPVLASTGEPHDFIADDHANQ
jgi:DNA modification methylase